MWIDSHCHLDMIEGGVGATVAAARAEGVERLVTIGVDIASSIEQVNIAERHAEVWATVGVHPNEATGYGPPQEDELRRLAAHPKVVGIGEAGLDNYRKTAAPEDQERSFRSQIAVAKDLDLALVVHTRDAQADTKRLLSEEGSPQRLVMHCFSGDADDARDYLDLGAVLSFSGTVTFRNAPGVQAAARVCPLDRLLLETDSPFLSPHPYRGQPNSPARIPVIGAFVARLKDVTPAGLAARVAATSRDVWAGRRDGGDW